MKVAVTLLVAGLSTVAFAQQPAQERPAPQPRQNAAQQQAPTPAFETADKNADGKLSREEASAVRGLDFAKADANKDSALDRQEFMTAIAKTAPPRG